MGICVSPVKRLKNKTTGEDYINSTRAYQR